MNESRGSQVLALGLSLCLSLYAVFSVMLTQGNSISEMCFILMVGGVLLCLVSPRMGFIVWIVSSGYMDLIKRLTVVSGRVQQMDLYYILGIHPLMLCSLCLSLFGGVLLGRQKLVRADLMRLLASLVFMLLVALMAAREKGLHPGPILSDVANNGLYSLLFFLVPIMLPTMQSMLKALRITVIVYAPVAIYGIIQQASGFQDFEVEYLLSGLTIEIKQLFDNEVRAFSTLNSPTALSFVSGMGAVLVCILAWLPAAAKVRARLPGTLAIVLIPIFLGSLVASTARSAFVMIPVAIAAYFLFHDSRRLRVFYGVFVVGFISLILSSGWLLEELPAAMNKMAELAGDSQFAGQILRVGTYSDRLIGFSQVLSNPKAYSWFGFGPDRGGLDDPEFYNHDPLSSLLVRYGVLALLVLIFMGFFVLRHFHRAVWRVRDPEIQRVSALLLSIPLGFLVASLMQGNVFGTFPLNLFSFLCLGMVESICTHFSAVVQPVAQATPPMAVNPAYGQVRPLGSPGMLQPQARRRPFAPMAPGRHMDHRA